MGEWILLFLLLARPKEKTVVTDFEPREVALHPSRVASWVARIFLAAVIVLLGWSAWRFSSHTITSGTDGLMRAVDVPTRDRAWFAAKRAEIASLDSQIAATKDALDRLEKRKKPTFSIGGSEREEFDRLNETARGLEVKKAQVSAELSAAEASRAH